MLPSALVPNQRLDAPKALNSVARKNICPARGELTPCRPSKTHRRWQVRASKEIRGFLPEVGFPGGPGVSGQTMTGYDWIAMKTQTVVFRQGSA